MGAKQFLSASATRIYPRSSASNSSASELHVSQSNRVATHDPLSRRLRALTLTRLVLTVVVVILAVAVIACEAHTLHVYNRTNLDGSWGISRLWPVGLDLRVTQAKLVAASLVIVAALLTLVVGIIPLPERGNLLIVLLSTGLAVTGLIAAGFGVAYPEAVRRSRGEGGEDIRTWTCRWVAGARDVEKMFPGGLADIAAPKDFGRLCRETKAAFGLLATLIALQAIVAVVTALCAWVENKRRNRARQAVLAEKGMADGGFP